MTGIVAIISKRNEPIGELLIKMMKTLKHRGPKAFACCINGEHSETIYSNDLNELDVANLKGAKGVGGNFFDPINKNLNLLEFNKGICVFDGEFLESNIKVLDQLMTKCADAKNLNGFIKKIIDKLVGGFSIGILLNNKIIFVRDIIGIRPIFMGENNRLIAFASEKKALWQTGVLDRIEPLLPGEGVVVTKNTIKKYSFRDRLNNKVIKIDFNESVKKVKELLINSTLKKVKNHEAALLFSGGLDSSILAQIFINSGIDVQLFCSGFKDGKDFKNSVRASKTLGLPLVFEELTDERILTELDKIIYHLESNDTVTAEIASPFYFATKAAKEHGFKNIFSGQGADEIFAGYSRYEKILHESGYNDLQNALFYDVTNIWQHNILRDDRISMANTIELKMPYLDDELVKFCMCVPPEYKLKENVGEYEKKYILKTVGKKLNLPNDILNQPKIAVQYGSGASKSFRRISTRLGLNIDLIKEYGFNSGNELMMNLMCYKLGFPENEIKNVEKVKNLISYRDIFSKF